MAMSGGQRKNTEGETHTFYAELSNGMVLATQDRSDIAATQAFRRHAGRGVAFLMRRADHGRWYTVGSTAYAEVLDSKTHTPSVSIHGRATRIAAPPWASFNEADRVRSARYRAGQESYARAPRTTATRNA